MINILFFYRLFGRLEQLHVALKSAGVFDYMGPWLDCISCFAKMRLSCFTMERKSTFQMDINLFCDSYVVLIDDCRSKNVTLSCPLKMHVVASHCGKFLQRMEAWGYSQGMAFW